MDDGALDRIEDAVAAAEEKTSAEFVVVVARRSAAYRDASLLGGALLALTALVVATTVLVVSTPLLLVVDVCLAFVAGTLLVERLPGLKRRLLPEERMRDAVRAAAERAMHRQGVTLTRERTSLLVYLSLLEKRVEFLADTGFDQAVSAARRNAILHRLRKELVSTSPVPALEGALTALGALAAEALPPGDENPNEIPDRPVLIDD